MCRLSVNKKDVFSLLEFCLFFLNTPRSGSLKNDKIICGFALGGSSFVKVMDFHVTKHQSVYMPFSVPERVYGTIRENGQGPIIHSVKKITKSSLLEVVLVSGINKINRMLCVTI